jgi:hypothetical protein
LMISKSSSPVAIWVNGKISLSTCRSSKDGYVGGGLQNVFSRPGVPDETLLILEALSR